MELAENAVPMRSVRNAAQDPASRGAGSNQPDCPPGRAEGRNDSLTSAQNAETRRAPKCGDVEIDQKRRRHGATRRSTATPGRAGSRFPAKRPGHQRWRAPAGPAGAPATE